MTDDITPETTGAVAKRQTPDGITLTAGVLAVALAAHVLIGGSGATLLWVIAVGAVGIGLLMLLASLRDRRRK
ncbi:hypothetical protein HUO13_33690 [Saccharopolyspora erythraea]|uniref:hypothetical protein n=1 Tax=Saccharopolyspora erythraea TaxID=1836 RepID=UPI001BA941F3|nr:hypothetical protein [Saccharopolyspora erythraea]QUH05073.1 hypothetical protein HUO13_33690 [Saccharopolyspora erythraea]